MRSWEIGDPEPSDHPAIVDDDSITWLWLEVEEDEWLYCQVGVSINGNGGEGPRLLQWCELLQEFGPVREATSDEVASLDLSYGA